MSNPKTGYRAFPPTIGHPSRARRFTKAEFDATTKTKLEEAPPFCTGHAGTAIWYVERQGYIVETRFTEHPSVYIESICTFTPTMGMDRIDGEFAQDAEELALHETLGHPLQRLSAFGAATELPIQQYLKIRGLIQ